MDERQIDWSSAVVDAGHTLTVALTGGPDPDWSKSFNRIMRPLQREAPQGIWGEIRLIRGALQVSGVQDGSEADLREFLETAVRQANDEVIRRGLAQEKAAERDRAEVEDHAESADRMTDRFRQPPAVGER